MPLPKLLVQSGFGPVNITSAVNKAFCREQMNSVPAVVINMGTHKAVMSSPLSLLYQ